MKITVKLPIVPELDPDFIPAALWNKEYRKAVAESGISKDIVIALYRPNGTVSRFDTAIFEHTSEYESVNIIYVERIVKFLLWMKGGYKVSITGCPEIVDALKSIYCDGGARAFDAQMMGMQIYGHPFEIVALDVAPESHELSIPLGGHMDGCRVGFDLGGSDRKCAAVIDGKVIYTEEVAWNPYFQTNPQYHYEGIVDSIRRAAAHLPRIDAIGGSAAGVYVDSQPRLVSLFRGVNKADFRISVVPMFDNIAKEFNVPFVTVNDGEVTALAGATSMKDTGVLGISMGTSVAAGYVNMGGNITDWLNEQAFTPVDYRENGPVDEWSGDIGCGVQFFCQQGVARLAKKANLGFANNMPFPEQLIEIQKLMANQDERAAAIYRTIGVCFGYTIAHYCDFYELKNLLFLGRVSSGTGGEIIMDEARKVLSEVFPELAVKITVPDENFKRHGQAVIAATLPDCKGGK